MKYTRGQIEDHIECRADLSTSVMRSMLRHLLAENDTLRGLLTQAVGTMERDAEKIEGEWGVGRTLGEMEEDDDLPEIITRAREALRANPCD